MEAGTATSGAYCEQFLARVRSVPIRSAALQTRLRQLIYHSCRSWQAGNFTSVYERDGSVLNICIPVLQYCGSLCRGQEERIREMLHSNIRMDSSDGAFAGLTAAAGKDCNPVHAR